jgi:hypothetical protein
MNNIYTIINQKDGNDLFNIEADSEENAAFAALGELGWSVVSPQDVQENNPDQYEFEF